MDSSTPEHIKEEKIEDVLKQIKQELDAASLDTPASGGDGQAGDKEKKDAELKNLKNVLLTADLQAGSVPVKKDASTDEKQVSFNENFLKLEKMIKDLKGRQ